MITPDEILAHFGAENQKHKTIEELKELFFAHLSGNRNDVKNEIADVNITLTQIMLIYGITVEEITGIDVRYNDFAFDILWFEKELEQNNRKGIVISICRFNWHMDYFLMYYGFDKYEISQQIDFKLNRTEERIKSGYYEGKK